MLKYKNFRLFFLSPFPEMSRECGQIFSVSGTTNISNARMIYT
jgi:hypothetical protein